MRTVREVSRLAGVSVRTLHHYDAIGLLKPSAVTEAGYRLYDDTALQRLQTILLFRELEFPLKEIKTILDSPGFDRGRALEQQITMLTLKKEHLEDLIRLAKDMKTKGENHLDFTAFDTSKLDEYAAQAKAAYGKTAEYQEFAEKSKGRAPEETRELSARMMALFAEFGAMRQLPPESPAVQAQVEKLQAFITEHFYTCSKKVLCGLGEMYAGGGEMTANIDKAGGSGTAGFVRLAIRAFCPEEAGERP